MAAATTTPAATRPARGLDLRQAHRLAVAGALGAVLGLFFYTELVRPFPTLRQADALWWARNVVAGGCLGGLIGFFLNAAEPFRDGAPFKLARTGTWGCLSGAIGGAIGLVVGELVLGGLRGGVLGRAVSWSILGLAIGASQGLAYRSRQRLLFGLLGGGLGGLGGGFLFETLRTGLGNRYDLSQGLGVAVLGGGLGLALAFVEQVLRRAWVVVLNGRQEGRSYLLGSSRSAIGLDERAAVGLFGDKAIVRRHAEIERAGGRFLLRELDGAGRTRVNGKAVGGDVPLADGDRIELGHTLLIFRQR
jgi:hypothetical protein